eukprot:TRINITY_DN1508_c0_g1::TRINITY_DN1508_c0_g1_i1::g.28159::m.28159 TRINITY_DN1508_c0_g1::TRINITY_DN1508_c0_g1_i1::g.28159  ORF type:complete len:771 (-),score=225.99 TRINITY_DN1508_c0_g1_i1:186-2498(-)
MRRFASFVFLLLAVQLCFAKTCPENKDEHVLFAFRFGDECQAGGSKKFPTLDTFADMWQHRPTTFDLPNTCLDLWICDIPFITGFVVETLQVKDLALEDIKVGWNLGPNGENQLYVKAMLDLKIVGQYKMILDESASMMRTNISIDVKDYAIQIDGILDPASVPLSDAKIAKSCSASPDYANFNVTFAPLYEGDKLAGMLASLLEPFIQVAVSEYMPTILCTVVPDSWQELGNFLEDVRYVIGNDTTCGNSSVIVPGKELGFFASLFARKDTGEPIIRLDCPNSPWTGQGLSMSSIGDVLQHRPTTFDLREICGDLDGVIPTLEEYDFYKMNMAGFAVRQAEFGYNVQASSQSTPAFYLSTAGVSGTLSGWFDVNMKLFAELKGEAVIILTDYTFGLWLGIEDASHPAAEAKLINLAKLSDSSDNIKIDVSGRDWRSSAKLAVAQPVIQKFVTDSLDDLLQDWLLPETWAELVEALNSEIVQHVLEWMDIPCRIGVVADHYIALIEHTVKTSMVNGINGIANAIIEFFCGKDRVLCPAVPTPPIGNFTQPSADEIEQATLAMIASMREQQRLQHTHDHGASQYLPIEEYMLQGLAAMQPYRDSIARVEAWVQAMRANSSSNPAPQPSQPAAPYNFPYEHFQSMAAEKVAKAYFDNIKQHGEQDAANASALLQAVAPENKPGSSDGDGVDLKLAVGVPVLAAMCVGGLALFVREYNRAKTTSSTVLNRNGSIGESMEQSTGSGLSDDQQPLLYAADEVAQVRENIRSFSDS